MSTIHSILDINFAPGRIKHINFPLTMEMHVTDHLHELDEDMLQVEYDGNIILDVGWYPSFNPHGQFKIFVIENHDWDKPKLCVETREIRDALWLLSKMREYIEVICLQD